MLWFHAISRRDGSPADGIHLLWAPPTAAGYSFEGWDLWRRPSRHEPGFQCYTLSSAELATLHQLLRVEVPVAGVSLRRGTLPHGAKISLPDEPSPAGPSPDEDRPVGPIDELSARIEALRGDLERARASERIALERLEAAELRPSRPSPRAPSISARPLRRLAETPIRRTPIRRTSVPLRGGDEPERPTPELAARRASEAVVTLANELHAAKARLAGLREAEAARAANLGAMLAAVAQPSAAWVYEIELDGPPRRLRVDIGAKAVFAVGLREGKAAVALAASSIASPTVFDFGAAIVDTAVIYALERASSLRICGERFGKEDQGDWHPDECIARGLQLPFAGFDPSLGDLASERARAESRLLPGESLGPGDFERLSRMFRAAAETNDRFSPVYRSWFSRERSEDPFVELPPMAYGLALTVDPGWRRALGFGFLDPDKKLSPGASYDYRLVGRFHRRDLAERTLGFHSIPLGVELPGQCDLGGIRLEGGPGKLRVAVPKQAGDAALEHGGRKGLALRGWLRLRFPEPVSRVVLELEPDFDHNLHFEARTIGLLFGSALVGAGPVPREPRVELDFPSPIEELELRGQAFLYALRSTTLAPGEDADAIVELSQTIYGVRYEPTPPPPPPPALGTVNLQKPTPTIDPAVDTPPAPGNLGFHLYWLPPTPPGSLDPALWPPDLGTAPPFEMMGFSLERRAVDAGGGFEPVAAGDEDGLPLIVGGARGYPAEPEPLRWGDELLERFPEQTKLEPPVPVWMDYQDVLTSPVEKGPEPGSHHQYRIRSVDLTGRQSTPTLGSIVRLEKRVPPPKPPGPPEEPDPQVTAPSGVRVRVLQAGPHLSSADQALLAGHNSAIVLRWGWTEEQRRSDRWATEFRVYLRAKPPDEVRGMLTGSPTWTGSEYRFSATLDRPVRADQLRDVFIRAGKHPFRILGHGAGTSVMLRLAPSAVDPTRVPAGGSFVLTPPIASLEERPPAWDERVAVVPITSAKSYEHVFFDRLSPTAAEPRARAWVGVSAADDQSYIADERPSGTNGNRPGNESNVVWLVASARWRGKPSFTIPPPLPTVPTVLFPEVPGETTTTKIDFPTLIPALPHPAGMRFLLERISGAEIVAMMSARNDGKIGASFPDGTSESYTLANPGDQSDLLAAIQTGQPAQIANRFTMDFVIRYADRFPKLWQAVGQEPASFTATPDTVANKAERWFYRVRAVDQAGRVSDEAAILPRVYRVPSRQRPPAPELLRPTPADDELSVSVRVADAFELAGIMVFSASEDAATPVAATANDRPSVLRVANRPDLYPSGGVALREADGTVLSPSYVAKSTATVNGGYLSFELTLTPGYERRTQIWALAVTRDGVVSPVVGPEIGTTGTAPPLVPSLSLSSVGGMDHASWSAPADGVMVQLERSTDAGQSWTAVSPWLSSGITSRELQPSAGTRSYRLRARGPGGRQTTGAAVAGP